MEAGKEEAPTVKVEAAAEMGTAGHWVQLLRSVYGNRIQ